MRADADVWRRTVQQNARAGTAAAMAIAQRVLPHEVDGSAVKAKVMPG